MARIFYFTLQDEQTRHEKIDWFANIKIEKILFDEIIPDKKANWVNQTDNNFDDLLPLVNKEVKAGRSEEAIFKLFSTGLKTKKDEWVYDVSKNNLVAKIKFFIEIYQKTLNREKLVDVKNQIKWDRELENYLEKKLLNNLTLIKLLRLGIVLSRNNIYILISISIQWFYSGLIFIKLTN